MKEIKKSASLKSKVKGKETPFNIDLNYSSEYDSFNVKVKKGEGIMSYTDSLQGLPLEVVQKLNEMLEEVLIKAGSKYEMKEHKMFDGGNFQSGVYAKGGSLESHGIKQGDTFLKTISGGIQQVKDKNGNIFYINLATGERSVDVPLPFDEGGEVKYFINKDGIKVRSKVEPKEKLTEAEWMAKHNESKEARGYAFGGLFGKSSMMSRPKHIDLDDKQVRLKSGEYVQVLDQDGESLMVMEVSKLGTGATPKMVTISDVDMTSFASGGEIRRFDRHAQMDSETRGEIMDVIQDLEIRNPLTNYLYGLFDGYDYSKTKNFKSQMNKLRAKDFSLHKRIKEIYSKIDKYQFEKFDEYADGGGVEKISFEDWLKKNNIEVYKRTYYWVADDGGSDYMYSGSKGDVMKSLKEDYKKSFANGGGVGLIGNQKRIDMNHNGKIDAEDFEIMRNTMDGAWRKERKYVNSTSRKDGKVIDYEVRYARKNNPSRKGYNGKTFANGGSIKMVDGKMYEKVKFSNGIEDWYRADLLHRVNFYCSQNGLNPNNQKDFEKALENVSKKSFSTGGKTTFKEKSSAIAKKFEGKRVEPKYQKDYGKVYSKEEAKEVGNKITGSMVSKEKMATGGTINSGYFKNEIDNDYIDEINKYFNKWNNIRDEKDSENFKNTKPPMFGTYKSNTIIQQINHFEKIGIPFQANEVLRNQFKKEVSKMIEKYLNQKMATGGQTKKGAKGGIMVLAKKIRKDGESWKDALKRAGQQLK